MILTCIVLQCSVLHLASGQSLIVEDFDYPGGDSLTSHGWETRQSTTTNALLATSPGLEYTGYIGSGVGNAASLTTTGQDVYKEFAPDSSGSFYSFFMVKVTASGSGDYFFHYHSSPVSSSYFGRTFVRTAANGNLAFGVAKKGTNSNPTAVYTDSIYQLETTYVLVVKYTIRDGSTRDDEATLFVFDSQEVPSDEPTDPSAGPVTDETADAKKIGAIALRQGSSSSSPDLIIDGFRVGRTWASALPIALTSFHATMTQAGLVHLEWRTESEIDNYGFVVQRSATPAEPFEDIPNCFVPGRGTTTLPSFYSFVDTLPAQGDAWRYRLKQIDLDGSIHLSDPISVEILSHVLEETVSSVFLSQNHPNPFNSETEIRFRPGSSGLGRVEMFNLLGEKVRTLFNSLQGIGSERKGVHDPSQGR
jgi:hypothetical protein